MSQTASGAPLTAQGASSLERDASLCLAFLIEHQGEWVPEIVVARSYSNGLCSSGGGQVLPLTLVGRLGP